MASKSKVLTSKNGLVASTENVKKEIIDTKLSSNNDNSSKFRIQGSCFFLTYKSHVPWEDIYNVANGYSKNNIEWYIICHELAADVYNGDKEDYEHTHACIKFNKKLNIRDCKVFDIKRVSAIMVSPDAEPPRAESEDVLHPCIEATRNIPASIQYCIKETVSFMEKRGTKNYWSNFDVSEKLKELTKSKSKAERGAIADLCEKIAGASSAFDAIKENATDLRDVMAIKMIYESKNVQFSEKLIERYKSKELRPWQKKIYGMVQEPPTEDDDRTVHWIVDKEGNKGKSFFCMYTQIQNPDRTLVITATGSVRDISDIIRNECMEKKKEPELLLLDLSRTFEDRDSIYAMIETLKNGMITCTKYKGATFAFVPPHIVVFSNWMPKLKKLSMDRWNIMKLIGDSKDPKMISINAYECEIDVGDDEVSSDIEY